jgi:hypothetical protein
MVYLDADNDLEPFGIIDLNEMEKVGSTADVNIIVQMDRTSGYDVSNGNWTGTKRFRVTKDNSTSTISSAVLQDLGEVNMGDPNSLTSFISWATTNYPATNYALVLWDHGGGWQKKGISDPVKISSVSGYVPSEIRGLKKGFITSSPSEVKEITGSGSSFKGLDLPAVLKKALFNPDNVLKNVCVDETSGDVLYNREVSDAIAGAGIHLNLIGFDACLMAMIENAYQLRNLGDFMVGSEETEPGDGWPYDLVLADLKATPDMTPASLAQTIVIKYGQYYDAAGTPTTQSAIDLQKIGDVKTKLDAFTQAIVTNNTLWSNVAQANEEIDKYTVPEHKDLYHLAQKIQDMSSDATVDAAAGNLKAAIAAAVIQYHSSSPKFVNSKGIAIYMSDASNYNAHYGEASNGIQFMQDSQWDEFLLSSFNGGNGGGGSQEPLINFGTDLYEPNNNFALAYGPVKNSKSYEGYLVDASDIDLYRLEIPAESDLNIQLNVPADFDLYLLQESGSDFVTLVKSDNSGTTSEGMAGMIQPGVYYLAVTAYVTNPGPYQLTVSGIQENTIPASYHTTLAYDFGNPEFYLWGTTLGDAAACMYTPPAVPARINKIWFNIQNLDAGALGGDGTFYLYLSDYYGALLPDTLLKLTPPDTGWLYLDLSSQNINVYGDFVVAFMYDGFNTPGIGYDTLRSFGNNLFFSTDYINGYSEDPGTYYLRAEVEYTSASIHLGTSSNLLDPAQISVFPNPFRNLAKVNYSLPEEGEVDLRLCDLQGRILRREHHNLVSPGNHEWILSGDDLLPGIYFVQVLSRNGLTQKKLVRK